MSFQDLNPTAAQSGLATPVAIIAYAANNSFNMGAYPTAKMVAVTVQAGGGGGGSGAMNTATNAASGGAGGGGGGTSYQEFVPADLNNACTIIVGPGGQGGASVLVTGAGMPETTETIALSRPSTGRYSHPTDKVVRLVRLRAMLPLARQAAEQPSREPRAVRRKITRAA